MRAKPLLAVLAADVRGAASATTPPLSSTAPGTSASQPTTSSSPRGDIHHTASTRCPPRGRALGGRSGTPLRRSARTDRCGASPRAGAGIRGPDRTLLGGRPRRDRPALPPRRGGRGHSWGHRGRVHLALRARRCMWRRRASDRRLGPAALVVRGRSACRCHGTAARRARLRARDQLRGHFEWATADERVVIGVDGMWLSYTVASRQSPARRSGARAEPCRRTAAQDRRGASAAR